MKITFLILTTLFLSEWVCAANSQHTLLNLLRLRRSISESTRFHNEYQRLDRNTKDNFAIPTSTPTAPSCVPGTRWRNDCNNCWCLATGATACTLLRCPKFTIINDDHGGRTVSLNSIQERDGKHSRTVSNRQKRSYSNNGVIEKPCKNGSSWMWKCNTCRCFNGHAACTRMRCRDE